MSSIPQPTENGTDINQAVFSHFLALFLQRNASAKELLLKGDGQPSVVLDNLFAQVVGDLTVAMRTAAQESPGLESPQIGGGQNRSNTPYGYKVIRRSNSGQPGLMAAVPLRASKDVEYITIDDSDDDNDDDSVHQMISKNRENVSELSPQEVLNFQQPGTSSGVSESSSETPDIDRIRATLEHVHKQIVLHNNNNGQKEFALNFGGEDVDTDEDDVPEVEEEQQPARPRLWIPKQSVDKSGHQSMVGSTVPLGPRAIPVGESNRSTAFIDRQVMTMHLDCTEQGCERKFSTLHALNVHLMVEHGQEVYVCQKCDRSFSEQNLLLLHCQNTHPTVSSWSCHVCPNKYRTYPQLVQHHYLQHQSGSFMCSFKGCAHTGNKRSQIYLHYTAMHNPNNPVTTQPKEVPEPEVKGDYFEDDEEEEEEGEVVVRHRIRLSPKQRYNGWMARSKQGLGPLECALCNKLFSTKFKLTQHERTVHSDTKPFKCNWEECTFRSKYRSNTLEHIKARHLKPLGHVGKSKDMAIQPQAYLEVDYDDE